VAVVNLDFQVNARQPTQELKQFTRQTQQLEASVKGAGERLRDANGRLIAAGQSAQQASTKIDLLNKAVGRLASQLVVADLARRFFKGFDEAERAAAAVRTLGVDSKVLEAQLLAVSNRLGGLYSQTQLVTAAYDVASAGFANAADAAKILEASAKGATGGLSDINTVGNAVTSVLNAYGKSANDAALLVDGFIQTQNDGKIILNEYAQQIGRLAPTAAAAGIGIKELNAAVSVITAQGVPVEATFTGLNQAIVSILKPTKEASDLAKALGIDFNEAGLRANGFGGLLKQVKEKTGGSTTALVQLFGSVDALKAVLPLVNDDLAKFNEFLDKQQKAAGVADKATEELGGTVSSEITKMVNQIGNLARAFDTVLGPTLGGVIKQINFIIAKATQGINVLGQLLSLTPNTTILKGALESGNLRGNAAPRVIAGIDELIGENRRKQLQGQAGAGGGFLGLGFDPQKFAALLKNEPAIKQLLGTGTVSKPQGGGAQGLNPEIEALLKSLEQGKAGAAGEKQAAALEKRNQQQIASARSLLRLAEDQFNIEGQILIARSQNNEALVTTRTAQKELASIANEIAEVRANKELPDAAKLATITNLELKGKGIARQLAFDLAMAEKQKAIDAAKAVEAITAEIAYKQNILTIGQQEADIRKRINDLVAQGVDPKVAEDRVRAEVEVNNQLLERQFLLQQEQQLLNAIGTTFTSTITGLIQGTNDFNDSLRNVLNSLANLFLQAGLQGLAGNDGRGFFSFLTGSLGRRAMGGSVSAGQPYLVGERGPELFMPGRSGGIAPAGSFGGGVQVGAVNITVQNTGENLSPAAQKQIASQVQGIVMATLVNQKRSGGIL
jgi:TP901 family phage tail tape measure protein